MRLILDPPRTATFNMAADEVLMERQKLPGAVPTLRIYFWKEPAITIGYFQDVARIARRYPPKNGEGGVVRRVTGGGLVRHGDDLTFSLALSDKNPFLPTDVKMSYLKVSEALRTGLKDSYPGIDYAECKTVPSGRGEGERVCFEKPACYDLLERGKKIVGASQRRRDGAILHQSSVYLPDPRPVLTEKILDGFRSLWKVEFEERSFDAEELGAIREKERERYGQPDWAFPVIPA